MDTYPAAPGPYMTAAQKLFYKQLADRENARIQASLLRANRLWRTGTKSQLEADANLAGMTPGAFVLEQAIRKDQADQARSYLMGQEPTLPSQPQGPVYDPLTGEELGYKLRMDRIIRPYGLRMDRISRPLK